VCYFKSAAETLGAIDVNIEVDGKIVQSDTISSLGDGVWQANILLDEAIRGEPGVRLRLGNEVWTRTLPLHRTS
jgi:hypothetical protein